MWSGPQAVKGLANHSQQLRMKPGEIWHQDWLLTCKQILLIAHDTTSPIMGDCRRGLDADSPSTRQSALLHLVPPSTQSTARPAANYLALNSS